MKKIVIFIPLILGSLVGFLLKDSFVFYQSLDKPFFAPPNWIFPIVWTILYLIMGISYYLVRSKDDSDIYKHIFNLQLFFNLLWSIIFFIFEQLLLSCLWIVVLDILIIVMILLFSKVDKKAGFLQIPYLVWTLFATILNISIFILNL